MIEKKNQESFSNLKVRKTEIYQRAIRKGTYVLNRTCMGVLKGTNLSFANSNTMNKERVFIQSIALKHHLLSLYY